MMMVMIMSLENAEADHTFAREFPQILGGVYCPDLTSLIFFFGAQKTFVALKKITHRSMSSSGVCVYNTKDIQTPTITDTRHILPEETVEE